MLLRQYQQVPSVPPIQETPTRVPTGKFSGSAGDDFAHDLVAGNQLLTARGQFSFDNMQVGAAHAAGPDLEKHPSRFYFGTRKVSNLKRVLLDRLRSCQNCGPHRNPLVVRAIILVASSKLLQTKSELLL